MSRVQGQVRIVGAGLLGTSIGLALSKLGLDVALASASERSQQLAIQYGAGRAAANGDDPVLVIVCVPPQLTAEIVAREISAFPEAVVTEVASVKGRIFEALKSANVDLTNFVGSHPMAGREKGGASAGRADLFIGRPWVIVPHPDANPEAIRTVSNLAHDLQATPFELGAADHDRAVALVSHLPQVISSLLAAQLSKAVQGDLNLAGQGLRDTTRIAASDPAMWTQILTSNAEQILPLLKTFEADLTAVISAFENSADSASEGRISRAIESGNQGVGLIPGKHGGSAKHYSLVTVLIDDKPGELARLLTEVGHIGVNLEDLKLEHSPGAQIGLVELYILPTVEEKLISDLVERGWRIA